MTLAVLAEGPGWVVIAKPPRLLVHRHAWAPRADAALQQLRDQLGVHVHPVHRIDFQASGCVLFATDPATCAMLQASMTDPRGRKRYVALVRGEFTATEPIVVANPMRDDQGVLREATTILTSLGHSAAPRCSLILGEPRSGRFHQVRRHARDLNHPVIGDTKHGDGRANAAFRALGLDRLALHAFSLELVLPDGGALAVTCPLFADQADVYRTMPWWPAATARLPALDQTPLAAVAA